MTTAIKTENEYAHFRGYGSLVQIVTELRRQIDVRHDFTIDARELRIAPDMDAAPGTVRLYPATESAREFVPRTGYAILPQALAQIGDKAFPGVPFGFLTRAIEASPERTCDYVTGLMHDHHRRRFVRVLDTTVRAFLSDTFRVIDSLSVLEQCLTVAKAQGARVLDGSLTDSHMRLRLVSDTIWQEIERVRTSGPKSSWYAGGLGDPQMLKRVAANSRGPLPGSDNDGQTTPNRVHPTLALANSETGHGRWSAAGGILQAACYNLATVTQVLTQIHLGGKLPEGIFSPATIDLEVGALMAKAKDLIEAYFTPESFAAIVERARGTVDTRILAPASAAQNLIKASNALGDSDLDNLLAFFIAQPGEPTVYNMGQAVARLAQTRVSPNDAEDLESEAGKILVGQRTGILTRA